METTSQRRGYYRHLNKWFDLYSRRFAKEFGRTVNFSAKWYLEGSRTDRLANKLAGDGKTFKETIESAMELAAQLAGNDLALAVAVLGLVQSAKTQTQFLGTILACIIRHLKSDRKTFYHPIFLCPNHKGTYRQQFCNKNLAFLACIEELTVTCNRHTVSIREYLEDCHRARNDFFRDIPKDEFNLMGDKKGDKFYRQVLLDGTYAKQTWICLGVSKKHANFLRLIRKMCQHPNHKIIICRDESHAATKEGSQNDCIFSEDKDTDESFYDAVNHHHTAQFVAVSATNFPALSFQRRVKIRIDPKTYCGFNFGVLWMIDEKGKLRFEKSKPDLVHDGELKEPDVFSLSEYAKACGAKYLPHVNPRDYPLGKNGKNADRYDRNVWDDNFADHDDYRKKCEDSIVKLLKYLLIDVNPKNHRRALLRFVNDNDEMEAFIQAVERRLPGIKIIREFGRDDPDSTIQQVLESPSVNLKDDEKYLIIVTGGGRMSDTFPGHCGYGIDFTRKSSITALLQGVLGRMCGYNKNPLVILSDENAAAIRDYKEQGYTHDDSTVGDHDQRLSETLYAGQHPRLKPIFDTLRRWLNTPEERGGPTPYTTPDGKPRLKAGVDFDFLDLIGGKSTSLLRNYVGDRFMMPGETDRQGGTYGPKAVVNLRFIERENTGSNKTGGRRRVVVRPVAKPDGTFDVVNFTVCCKYGRPTNDKYAGNVCKKMDRE